MHYIPFYRADFKDVPERLESAIRSDVGRVVHRSARRFAQRELFGECFNRYMRMYLDELRRFAAFQPREDFICPRKCTLHTSP